MNGVLQFALVVVVTQALTKSEAGAFFVAVALFIILSNTCELGADTGLTRMIPRLRVLGRIADIRRSMAVGILPGFVAGIVLAELTFFLADPLAAIFTNHQHADADRVATYIRVLAAFLPVSAAYTVSIAATRGFGTMLPNALVDRIGRARASSSWASARSSSPAAAPSASRWGGGSRSPWRSRSRWCGSSG